VIAALASQALALPSFARKPPHPAEAARTQSRTPEATKESPVSNAGPVTLEAFLKNRPAGPFEVRIGGTGADSFLKRTRCGYWEWTYGERHEGKLASYTVVYHSEAPLFLDVDGKTLEVSARKIRTYLTPSFERDYAVGDLAAPEIVRARMKEEKKGLYAAEHCLEVGKTYHALVRDDEYLLPPDGPGSAPRTGHNRVLLISDRPFVDGKPVGEVTPGFRGWSY
jgi:hypothetical protein